MQDERGHMSKPPENHFVPRMFYSTGGETGQDLSLEERVQYWKVLRHHCDSIQQNPILLFMTPSLALSLSYQSTHPTWYRKALFPLYLYFPVCHYKQFQ